jgi:protein involved in polysaccharide export with SLBB domain
MSSGCAGAIGGCWMTRWLVSLFVMLALAGSTARAQTPPDVAQPPASPAATQTPASAPADRGYRLGAGDKVRIIVFGEESLTGEYLVPGGTGKISFPLVGDVSAGGLTVGQFETELEHALADGFLKQPRVSVEVLEYRPFFILGEVMKPGEYPYINGLTVLNAVATANGFTYRADTRKVYIRRANSGQEQQYKLTTSTPVEPGDTIRIGERFF